MVDENLIRASQPELDSLICKIFDAAPRDDLKHSLFSLSTKTDSKVRRYERSGIFIDITPSTLGHATSFDNAVLFYFVKQVFHELESGRAFNKKVRVNALKLLESIDGLAGKKYEQLEMALKRLRGTTITTNLNGKGRRARQGFGLIDSFEISEDLADDKLSYVELTLSECLARAITQQKTAIAPLIE